MARGDHASALDLLLVAWRELRHPRIADALSRLRVAGTRPGGASLHGKQSQWLTQENLKRAIDAALLVATLTDVRVAEAHVRLKALETREDDPRIATGLVDCLRTPAYQAKASVEFWKDVCDLIVRIADIRTKKSLSAVHADLRFSGGGSAGRALARILPSVLAGVEKRSRELMKPLPKSAEADLAAIEAAVAVKPESSGADLLEAIYANPDDDAPRLVYADFLQERGDPLGEFIALQIQGASVKRQNELLRLHQKEWLGALAPALLKVDRHFARGFLESCRLKAVALSHLERLMAAKEWGTVRELDVTAFAMPYHAVNLVQAPAMRSLRVLRGIDWRILETAKPLAIEELEIGALFGHGVAEKVAACASLPKLKRLRLYESLLRPHEVEALWKSPLAKTLELLEVPVVPNNIEAWIAAKTPVRVRLVAGMVGWRISVENRIVDVTRDGLGGLNAVAQWIRYMPPRTFERVVVHARTEQAEEDAFKASLSGIVESVDFKAPGERGRRPAAGDRSRSRDPAGA